MHISVWATAAERQKVESAIHHLIAMFAAHDVTVTAASGHNVLVGEDHAVEADRLTVNAPKLALTPDRIYSASAIEAIVSGTSPRYSRDQGEFDRAIGFMDATYA
jgi:hypothetical protein